MTDSNMTEEQPIDIHQYTRAIRRALPQIVVLALIVAITAAVVSSLLPSKAYTASTTILARDTLVSTQALDATTATRRLATVHLLTRTTDVLSLAASKLPGTTVGELRAAIHSSVDPEANVITITATADTADAAAARANQVAPALIATERRIEQQGAAGALRAALAEVEQLRKEGATNAEIQVAEDRLASLTANADGAASGFQVVQSAERPTRPSSPPSWFSGIVAFLAIVVLGMLVVLAREQVAPRVSSSQDLGQVFSMPVLASIPLVRRVKPNDLPLLPQSVRDAFFVLASAVRLNAKEHGTKIVFVVSAIQGEGRTTVAANLSQALSTSGASVLAVCADLRSPRLHEWFDTPQSPGLTDVLALAEHGSNVRDVAEPVRSAPSATLERAIRAAIASKNGELHVLPSGLPTDDPTPLLFGDAIPSVFNAIRALLYDFVVVDTPPGFGVPDIRALAPHADAFLVVARTHLLRMSQAVELRDLLDEFDKEKLGLAVFEREAHPISHLAPDGIHKARTGAAIGKRELIELS
jgi:Mrp family chromosome partitioning ATPase